MENDFSLQRIRDVIFAAHSVSNGIISFDTSKSWQLGYTDAEIDAANRILAIEQVSYLQELFKSKVAFCNYACPPCPYHVHYIPIANMIFVCDTEAGSYTYITEEELEYEVNKKKEFLINFQYVCDNSYNDAMGNPI